MENKQSMSLLTLSHMTTEYLYEIVRGKEFDEETKQLAQRVINARIH